jgi:hypothetical protein
MSQRLPGADGVSGYPPPRNRSLAHPTGLSREAACHGSAPTSRSPTAIGTRPPGR